MIKKGIRFQISSPFSLGRINASIRKKIIQASPLCQPDPALKSMFSFLIADHHNNNDNYADVLDENNLGWKFMSYCQELGQQASWLLIGCTRVDNQSKA